MVLGVPFPVRHQVLSVFLAALPHSAFNVVSDPTKPGFANDFQPVANFRRMDAVPVLLATFPDSPAGDQMIAPS